MQIFYQLSKIVHQLRFIIVLKISSLFYEISTDWNQNK